MITANKFLPTHDASGVHKFRPTIFPAPAGPGVGGTFAAFTRWDAAWFLSIADSRYPSVQPREQHWRKWRPGDDLHDMTVDCAGTERAWGGAEYAKVCHEEQRGMERDASIASGGRLQRPRCREDIPLQEQAHAFFPFYPWIVRWTSTALHQTLHQVPGSRFLEAAAAGHSGGALVLSAVFVSNVCFVAAAILLYYLGVVVMGDTSLAFQGALVFCVNPANVFFSTAYTESLYALLSFAGLLILFSEGRRRRRKRRGEKKPAWTNKGGAGDNMSGEQRISTWVDALGGSLSAWLAAALLSLATLTRSNGIAGAGVLVLEKLRWMANDAGLFSSDSTEGQCQTGRLGPVDVAADAQAIAEARRRGSDGGGECVPGSERHTEDRGTSRALPRGRLIACACATVLQAALIVAPYVLVQAYAYRKFCSERAGYDDEERLGFAEDSAGSSQPFADDQLYRWCSWRVPSIYAHVQSAYWGVGALRYYQWKQIPNFLLAMPALLLTAVGAATFFSAQRVAPGDDLPLSPFKGTPDEHPRRQGQGGERRSKRQRPCSVLFALFSRMLKVFLGPPVLPHPGSEPFTRSGSAALVLQWGFLAVFAALCMNVQVATRFLAAACPPMHWWMASLLSRANSAGRLDVYSLQYRNPGAKVLRWYLGIYFVIGPVLHANFLPWT